MTTIELDECDMTSLRRFGIGQSLFGSQPMITLDPKEEASYLRLSEYGFVSVVDKNVTQWVAEVKKGMTVPGIDIRATQLVLDMSLMMLGNREQFYMFHITQEGTQHLIDNNQLLSDETIERAIDSLL